MRQLTLDECNTFHDKLFGAAVETSGFEAVCAVLRVSGYENARWDPLEETIRAFGDFNWVLERTKQEKGEDCQLRIALLMYCQAVEMTAMHEMLANLIRIVAGKPYVISPLRHLERKRKKSFFSVPPSATVKFREIKRLAGEVGWGEICEMIDLFFDERVRNAFSHSDYVVTEKHFRWTEGESPNQIPQQELLILINNCFVFCGAFLEAQPRWRYWLGQLKRYYKWPRYEVLELLASRDLGLYGFSVHFSNGSKATYVRKPGEGPRPLNVLPRQDGTIDFFVGDRDALERAWKIDGKAVADWDKLDNHAACDA